MVQVQFTVRPIGRVLSENGTFTIALDREYARALEGLEGYSHIVVLWWAHLMDSEEHRGLLQVQAPYTRGPERIGIFATRSPARPNPVAVSHALVLSVDHETARVTVPYLDIENETPVLDIKPYCPSVDRIREAGVPEWCDHWPKWYEDSAEFDWGSEFNFPS